MPVTFIDAQQEDEVNLIIDDLLENAQEDLRNNNIVGIYNRIMNSEVGRRMNGDRLGKITEVLLEMYPEMLHHIEELPMGMFYACDLTGLDIPNTVRKFGQGVFALSDIRTINYGGTRDEWISLTRNSDKGWDIMTPDLQKVGDLIVVNCTDAENIYDVHLDENLDESMTKKEVIFKRNVLRFLREDGFNTFADYLSHFHFNFLTSEQAGKPFVAAIAPNKGIVLINPNIDVDGISMILRHEAAHQIFKHMEHLFAKLKKLGIDTPSELAYRLSNQVGDYHISNYIYDEDDKYIAKHIKIENGEEFAGLVTELDFPEHPEYWTMDFDQLWDVFVKDYNKEDLEQKVEEGQGEQKFSDEFIEGWNALIDAYQKGEITKEQIERWFYRNM